MSDLPINIPRSYRPPQFCRLTLKIELHLAHPGSDPIAFRDEVYAYAKQAAKAHGLLEASAFIEMDHSQFPYDR
jgi:hypothetical protein